MRLPFAQQPQQAAAVPAQRRIHGAARGARRGPVSRLAIGVERPHVLTGCGCADSRSMRNRRIAAAATLECGQELEMDSSKAAKPAKKAKAPTAASAPAVDIGISERDRGTIADALSHFLA